MDYLKWYGPRIEAAIRAEMGKRLSACAIAVHNYAKRLINIDGTVSGVKGRRNKKGQFLKASLRYGANPSTPGDPPHKQHGRLLGSIAWELEGLIARVGTNLKYGRWLELGTTKMSARPWLRVALKQMQAFIKAVLSRPMDLR